MCFDDQNVTWRSTFPNRHVVEVDGGLQMGGHPKKSLGGGTNREWPRARRSDFLRPATLDDGVSRSRCFSSWFQVSLEGPWIRVDLTKVPSSTGAIRNCHNMLDEGYGFVLHIHLATF